MEDELKTNALCMVTKVQHDPCKMIIQMLNDVKRGHMKGKYMILTPEQEHERMKIIVDKHPEQLSFKECMWTRNNIHQFIKVRYCIDIKLSTLGYYLSRWVSAFSVR